MKQKMLVILAIFIIIIGILVYCSIENNKRIDREAVTFVEDMSIEYGKTAKVSDFIENLNGTLLNDHYIDTEVLGDIDVSFDYINIKNKKRTRTFKIKTIDATAPKILSGSSYTVKVGYSKNLTDVLLSGDDIDDNPVREIIGEYDFRSSRRL